MMSNVAEPSGRSWRIRPSIIAAYLVGMLVLYVLSAGPMACVLRSQPKLYATIYGPLCDVTDRTPSPFDNWFFRYLMMFDPPVKEDEAERCICGGPPSAGVVYFKVSKVLFYLGSPRNYEPPRPDLSPEVREEIAQWRSRKTQ